MKLLKNNFTIKKDQSSRIIFTDDEIQQFRKGEARQFLLLINNRGVGLLADSEAYAQGKKPVLTSFSPIIEMFPIVN